MTDVNRLKHQDCRAGQFYQMVVDFDTGVVAYYRDDLLLVFIQFYQ